MASTRTVNFLPEVFQTKANRKFLNATIDRLVTPSALQTINGYIGRKFSPTFKKGDNYLTEPTDIRQSYQLEPGVSLRDGNQVVTDFYSYADLIQQIEHYGGLTDNHSRLFASEMYSYHGFIDLDKIVNFSQYWWVSDKLEPVIVSSGSLPLNRDITVTKNQYSKSYNFDYLGNDVNPTLTLLRGGRYTFKVSQPGSKFWIQTLPGVSGTRPDLPNVSTRDVLGVVNNGIDNGTVTFVVPQKTDQDRFVLMPLAGTTDYVTSLRFTDVANRHLSDILEENPTAFDGATDLQGRTLAFIGGDSSDEAWVEGGLFNNLYGTGTFDQGQVVPLANRWSTWRVDLEPTEDGSDFIVKLSFLFRIPTNNRVAVRKGTVYAGTEVYRTIGDEFELIPAITATLDTLYYVDSNDAGYSGEIKIVDSSEFPIDVNNIMGEKTYTSTNGVEFSNGLLVKFDSNTVPATYANTEYYVEGVGRSIELVPRASLVVPELTKQFSSLGWDETAWDDTAYEKILGDARNPDYITIKRNSIDANAWSRSNRWVHGDVIKRSLELNGNPVDFSRFERAKRPIIEFRENLQLFNHGRVGIRNITLFNTTIQNALQEVEGSNNIFMFGEQVLNGSLVIFAADLDPIIRNNIYRIDHELINNDLQIHLVEVGQVQQYDSVVPEFGPNIGVTYHYVDGQWHESQQKTKLNQAPLFDLVTSNDTSISSLPGSNFSGTTLFSYKLGSGANDPVLGFPLSYKSFNNIGDIEFNNTYELETATHGGGTFPLNNYFVPVIQTDRSHSYTNDWQTVSEQSKQLQTFLFEYRGENQFEIDILPLTTEGETSYIKVFLNGQYLPRSKYSVWEAMGKNYVSINDTLTDKDSIVVQVFNEQVSDSAYFEVPKNLDVNSLNKPFLSTTLGQLRNHLVTIGQNSNLLVGSLPGNSNVRDFDSTSLPGAILQHSAPVVFASLFLLNKEANFIESLDYARKEYSRFKTRFLETVTDALNENIFDPVTGVDYILKRLNRVKSITSPWYFSDMVPYGDKKVTTSYTVINPLITEYQLDTIFDDTELSNRAVLVYLNGTQLVKGKDYTLQKDRSTVQLSLDLKNGDVLQIVRYTDTDGNFIPSTPTKLGMYPSYEPRIFQDTTYRDPTYVLQGHDGSLTPLFNDIRDRYLLELEKRIYNNIKAQYNQTTFDIYSYLPGKFRDTQYTRTEFSEILSQPFLSWVGNNQVDYSTNQWFKNSDPLTWNYSQLTDIIDGERLPGYWRGIFQYFYDTDTPHSTPWEMLGFTAQPTWWEARYGPAPWTGGNQVMWDDLEAGRIAEGDRAGTYPQYARPGLSKIIPVTDDGFPRAPNEFLAKQFSNSTIGRPFSVGDFGPTESAWKRSSDYPFAVQRAIALSRPAVYFGLLINLNRYNKSEVTNQYTLDGSNERLTPASVIVNGTESGGSVLRANGYLNWITEYMISKGIDARSRLKEILSSVDVNLGYQLAGFTDKNYIRVLAEQSSPSSINDSIIVPDSDYQVVLHKSPPLFDASYSAVIVERTSAGYSVRGYNTQSPFFNIVPSQFTSNSYKIVDGSTSAVVYRDFSEEVVPVPYGTNFRNRQEVVDFLVSYGRYLQASGFVFDEFDTTLHAQRDWVLSAREFLAWTKQGWREGSIVVLSPVIGNIKIRAEEVAIDEISNKPNGPRILDVGFNVVKSTLFTVLRDSDIVEVDTGNVSIGLIQLNAVQYEHALVFSNETVFRDVIFRPESGNRQYRLKIIGNKTGNWNGQLAPEGFVIVDASIPEWLPNQDYKKGDIVLFKGKRYTALNVVLAAETFEFSKWAELQASEFKTGMIPNFSYNAAKFSDIYDVDRVINDEQLIAYGNGLIGFRDRSFMTDTGMTPSTQVKFYQGYIKDKGTESSFNALASATFNNVSGDISFNEEWAFRVGEYGALQNNQYFEVVLDEAKFRDRKVTFTFVETEAESTEASVALTADSVYKKSYTYTTSPLPTVQYRGIAETDLLSAGYVHLDDVDYQVFSMSSIASLNEKITNITVGDVIWVATGKFNKWATYRVTKSGVVSRGIEYALNDKARVVFDRPHTFKVGEAFAIKNVGDGIDGFYFVVSIPDSTSVIVTVPQEVTDVLLAEALLFEGTVLSLVNTRVSNPNSIPTIEPNGGWYYGDKVWVDKVGPSLGWGVYEKTEAWKSLKAVDPDSYAASARLGHAAAVNSEGTFAIVGAPLEGASGAVKVFVTDVNDGLVFSESILNPSIRAQGRFGSAIAFAENAFIVGAPADGGTSDGNGVGKAYVYRIDPQTGDIGLDQVITSPEYAPLVNNGSDQFGAAIALSGDGKIAYIGAPGIDKVYVFTLDPVDNPPSNLTFTHVNTITGPASSLFGYSLATDLLGNVVAIGAPAANNKDGKVFVYDRYVEEFIGNKNDKTFQTGVTLTADRVRVLLNGQLTSQLYSVAGDYIEFTVFTPNITDSIRVETNEFIALDEVQPLAAGSRGQFGESVGMSLDAGTVLVGEPIYVEPSYSSGRVHVYVNTKTKYGQETPGEFLTLIESIKHESDDNEQFGHRVVIDPVTSAVAVSSFGATSRTVLGFDNGATIIDAGTTRFVNEEAQSGAVYIYEVLSTENDTFDTPAVLALSQRLETPPIITVTDDLDDQGNNIVEATGVNKGDSFGYSVSLSNGVCVVGSPTDSDNEASAGKIYEFVNPDGKKGWHLVREENERVEPNSIIRSFLYSNRDQSIHTMLDLLDPIKGRILGAAEQELDYKTDYDPAMYSVNAQGVSDGGLTWTDRHVNQIWWDTSTVRYIDYEQGDVAYRAANWGRAFPGSAITIAQWVESDVPPTEYVVTGGGTPKYLDRYSTKVEVDSTGLMSVKYYFWVIGKNSVDPLDQRHSLSTEGVRSLIENPESSGVSYISTLRKDTVSLNNVRPFLLADDTLFHLDFGASDSTGLVHNEYELIQEGEGIRDIPEKIVSKIVDSLSGQDSLGQVVPDPALGPGEKYGISVRPRQTVFANRQLAVQNFIGYVNTVLKDVLVVGNYSLLGMLSEEPVPANSFVLTVTTDSDLVYVDTSEFSNGDVVLVVNDSTENDKWATYKFSSITRAFTKDRVQGNRTSDFWVYKNWVASGFDPTAPVTYVVDRDADIATLHLQPNDTVQVEKSSSGQTVVYEFDSQLSRKLVKVANGTVELSDSLATDATASTAIRNIFYAVKDDLFVNQLQPKFNELFFVLLNFILSEQKKVDWAFKTSFISIVHNLRKLSQYPSYVRDNQTFYEEYVNEVKPYRTKIREYLTNYSGDEGANLAPTDFDLPAYYDDQLGRWRSPNGELARDATLINTDPRYHSWRDHHKLSVSDLILTSPGQGYSQAPTILISGGGGFGATAKATIDRGTGKLQSVVLTSPGSGYTSRPTVEVLGDGSGAKVYALLKPSVVRSITTNILFDRAAYNSDVVKWQPQVNYAPGTVVAFNNKSYSANETASFEVYFEDREIFDRTGWNFKWYDVNGNLLLHIHEPKNSANLYSPDESNHISLVRSESRFILYRDGAPVAATQVAFALPDLTTDMLIGNGSAGQPFNGIVSSLRITKGVARYIVPFTTTVPTDPLPENNVDDPDYDNVVLLQNYTSSSFDDLSNSSHTITSEGIVEYNSGLVFNGTDTLLLVPDSDDWYFYDEVNELNVDFTIEFIVSLGNSVINSNRSYSLVSQKKEYTVEEVQAFTFFNPLKFSVLDDNTLDGFNNKTALDRAVSFYRGGLSADDASNVLPLLFDGLDYPGVLVTAPLFTDSPLYDVDEFDDNGFDSIDVTSSDNALSESTLDSIIAGAFTDDLASDPEDVVIEGGGFIDDHSSHAPEELLPSRVFDTLDIRVFTNNPPSDADLPIAYRMFKDITDKVEYLRISDSYATVLAQSLYVDDNIIFVEDASRLKVPDVYNNDYGVVFINGERIQYAKIDSESNTLSMLKRGTRGTGTPAMHPAGEVVTDASNRQIVPGTRSTSVTTLTSDFVFDPTVPAGQAMHLATTGPLSTIDTINDRSSTVVVAGKTVYYRFVDKVAHTISGLTYEQSDHVVPSGSNVILNNVDVVWYELDPGSNITTASSTNGLYGADTVPANFLKNRVSYRPANAVDLNANAELFDFGTLTNEQGNIVDGGFDNPDGSGFDGFIA